MPTLENDTPLDEKQPLNPAISPESENCQPEIGLPVLSSTPQKPHLSPGGQKTSSAGQKPCSSVNTSSSGVITFSSNVPTSSSSGQTPSSGCQTSPSSGQTSSAGQTSLSSGLSRGHSRPLPSSPVTQNDSCNTESPNRSNCNCNCENVAARLQQLEHIVNGLMRAQPLTPKTPRGIPSKLTASAQKHEHVKKLEKSEHLFQRLIDDFRKFRLGSQTRKKDKDNARQAASHVLRFCLYMATELPSKTISMDLRFLLQMDKLRTYPVYLAQKGYVPTTVRNMLTNITQFIKHVKCSFQTASKVKSTDLDKIIYELKTLQGNVHKHVVVHRQKVVKKKTEVLPADGSFGKEHCELMGYLMGYLCILTGHRAIVLTNMTRDQVTSADCWAGGKKYRILVGDHKTMSSFGQAAVCLNKTEFQWVKKVAFGHCCLRGSVTFGQIRSSVSTQAKNHLTERERKDVANAMCHDPSTAERYYVALPDKKMAYQTRKIRMKALKEAFMKSSKDSDNTDEKSEDTLETTSDDGEVIYDDAPDSSSSLSSGEKSRLKRRKKRPHGFSKPDSESSDDESPEDEPRHKSKKKLDFSKSKKPSVHSAFSPYKCFVLVDRMSKSIEKEYTFKGKAKYRKLAKGMEESLETPVGEAVQKGETLQTPDEETPLPPGGGGEDIPETAIEEGAGNLGILEIVLEEGGGENLETLVEDTPLPPVGREEEILETLVEDMPAGEMVETPVEEAVGVGEILETLVEEGGGEEIIAETPVEDMPETQVINSCPVEDSGNPI
ncbi:hypothetical protein D5F01_LYC24132 [Larimichthys crocea]|uniref:Uncharacterized protein n=1 Tax=Larimichthys crocea TaxID=215358 RepID=A0A6G0HF59_LARCR|nr:hypothetical protein D5F01_LYC24132 [Larimichthys crocea]